MLTPRLVDRLAVTAARATGLRSTHLSTSTGRVHVLTARGHGPLPPIVLLHGFTSAAVHLYPLIRALQPHFRQIIAPDLPGHGLSDAPAAGLDSHHLARGLLEAMDLLLREPCVIFGNSMGGLAALRFALARQRYTHTLVLASPLGAPMTSQSLAIFKGSLLMRSYDDALAFVDRLTDAHVVMRHLYARGIHQRFSSKLARRLIDAYGEQDFLVPDEVRGITAPVLFVWGRGERVLPDAGRQFFEQHLPPHAVVETPPCGHSPYLEDARGFAARIASFSALTAPSPPPREEHGWLRRWGRRLATSGEPPVVREPASP